jgi:hypothetical protein
MRRTHLTRGIIASALVVIVATALLATALASNSSSTKRGTDFAILTKEPAAKAASSQPGKIPAPATAVLATTSAGNEVYVYRNERDEICLRDSTYGQVTGGCNPAEETEHDGEMMVVFSGHGSPATITLVPNGVNTVTFTETSGASASVAVTNNVAIHVEATPGSVKYQLADGTTRTLQTAGAPEPPK